MNKVSVYGGLGNQMFQYALYTALINRGRKTRLSFSTYLYYYHHSGFTLTEAFKIKLPVAFRLLNFFLHKGEAVYQNRFVAGILRRGIQFYQDKRYTYYREKKEFEYDSDVFEQQNVFFAGTWQAVGYLENIQNVLQQNFAFNMPADTVNTALMEKIRTSNSVSLHVRRGDYLNDHWQKILGVINGAAYYTNAMDYINQHFTAPHYFIFSDDIQWAKENLKVNNCTYVDNNKGKSSYIDMYLMSLCKHNIIANSTFSWWAAWLNKNPDKIVIMPEKWMNNNECKGVFVAEWIKMKV
ncbi:alpha-1,2-fucosyltransferase [Ferruginibacter sp.]|nr:alpha-1,2-fucosyltransferase [Ferruginibacter sp.]